MLLKLLYWMCVLELGYQVLIIWCYQIGYHAKTTWMNGKNAISLWKWKRNV